MRPEQIVEGATYKGGGAVYLRVVEFIIDVGGRKRVSWYTPNTMQVRRSDGSIIHLPHGVCWLDTFARWAREQVDE